MPDDELECRVEERDGAVVVTASGLLSLRGSVHLRQALDKPLMDRGRVVADVSALRIVWPAAAAVFPTALSAAGGWPAARLVLACSDPARREVLRSARTGEWVPVAPDLGAALRALDVRPARVLRTTALVSTLRAAQHVRALVAQACADWELPGHQEAATSVASELATNAFVHGRGELAVSLSLDERGLRIAVRDDGDGRPALVEDGYGLRLVDRLSAAWGISAEPPGKWVWALVRGPVPRGRASAGA